MTIKVKLICPKCGKVVGYPGLARKYYITDKLVNYYHQSCARRIKLFRQE